MLDKSRGYRFLEHTSDAYIEAWGPTLEEAFAESAESLFETMLSLEKVDPQTETRLNASGHDEKELLYNWLETLLLEFDINGNVYSKFDIEPITHDTSSLTLYATVKGEKYQPQKHGSKEEVKAVTYHQMEIQKQPDRTTLRFILDL